MIFLSDRYWLLLIVLAAVFLYAPQLEMYPFEWDEGLEAFYSRRVLEGEAPYKDFYYEKGPLSLYLGAAALFLHDSLFSLRLLAGLSNVVLLVLTYLLSERLFPGSGPFSALLVASRNLLPPLFFVFHNSSFWALFSLASILFFVEERESLSGLFSALSFCVKPLAVLPLLGLLGWSWQRKKTKRFMETVKWFFFSLALLFSLFSFHSGLSPFLNNFVFSNLEGFPFGLFLFERTEVLLFYFVLSVASLLSIWGLKESYASDEGALLAWLCGFSLLFFFLWSNMNEHYLYLTSPLFFLFAGRWLRDFSAKRKVPKAAVLLLLLLALPIDSQLFSSSRLYYTRFDPGVSLDSVVDVARYAEENVRSPLLTDYPIVLFLADRDGLDLPPISLKNVRSGRVSDEKLLPHVSAGRETAVLAHSRLYLLPTFVSELDLHYDIAYEFQTDGRLRLFTREGVLSGTEGGRE